MKNFIENFEKLISKKINLFLIFTFFLIFKLIYQVPLLNDGGDEAGQWNLAISTINGEYDKINSLHHNLRWANWLPSIIVGIFNDNYQGYYIFNFLRGTIGFFIFFYVISKAFSPLTSIVFLFLIFLEKDFMHFYFELNPLMSAIFYLSLIFLYILKKKNKSFEGVNLFIITLLFFFLYGAKIPFIFFYVGFIFYIYKFKGPEAVFKSIIYFVILYLLEALVFNLLNPEFSNLGRIYEIIFNNKVHIDAMNDTFPVGMKYTYIFERWLINKNSIAYILGIMIIGILLISPNKETQYFKNNIVINLFFYLGLSFFLLNTFFIISLKPFMMGQEHHSRYVAHLVFLIFPFVIYLFRYLIINSKLILLPLYFIVFVLIFYPHFSNLYQFVKHGKFVGYKNFNSISYHFERYDKYSKLIKNEKCFLLSDKDKASRMQVTLTYLDKNNYKIFFNGKNWLAERVGQNKCENYFNLDSIYEYK